MLRKKVDKLLPVSAALLLMAVLLIGCGSSNEAKGSGQSSSPASSGHSFDAEDPFAGAPDVEVADVQAGVALMNDQVKQFKQAVESDDIAQAQELSGQLAGVWVKIGKDVLAGNPQLHASLQEAMVKLMEQARADKPDRDRLVELSYTLYQQVRDARKQLQAE